MTNRALAPLVQLLRQFRLQRGGTTTDAELLELFISQRDEDAFETLVRRHGPMVLGVCRRILHNEADVEDCFQATFLVLVRKAAALRRRGLVSNWLYGTARKAALKARAMKNLRHRKEREAATEKVQMAANHDRDLQELLDQELERLPDKYRAAIVLCDLEGLTIAAAAQQLGCPQGTLNTRLVRGRAMLAKRLSRHGLAVSGGVLATALCQNAVSACVPGPLVVSTVKAATLLAAGKAAAAGAISAKVVALTEGVLKAMLMTKLKITLAVVLALNFVGAGLGLVYCQTAGIGQDKQGKAPVVQEEPKVPSPASQPSVPKNATSGAEQASAKDTPGSQPTHVHDVKFTAVVFAGPGNRVICEGRMTSEQFENWFKKDPKGMDGKRGGTPQNAVAFGALVLTDGEGIFIMPFYRSGDEKVKYYVCQGALARPRSFTLRHSPKRTFWRA